VRTCREIQGGVGSAWRELGWGKGGNRGGKKGLGWKKKLRKQIENHKEKAQPEHRAKTWTKTGEKKSSSERDRILKA